MQYMHLSRYSASPISALVWFPYYTIRSYCCSGCLFAGKGYDEKTASIAAIIFIFIPWNIMWFGRAQTDPLITALMTLAIALCVRAYKNGKSMLPFGIILGLAVFTKQPALAALPIVLIWSYFQGVKSILLKNPYRMNL